MDISVELANGSKLPDQSHVSVRIGDVVKQGRYEPSRVYHFPGVDRRRHVKVDVFRLVGSAVVPMSPESNLNTSQVQVTSSDPSVDNFELTLKAQCNQALVGVAECKAEQKTQIKADMRKQGLEYIKKTGIESKLAEGMKRMLQEKPDDPTDFLCTFLRQARALKDIQEAKELEEAALKIQSVRRGQLARAKASAAVEPLAGTVNDAQEATELEAQALKDIQEARELEEAALKIQSVRRGQLARAQTSTREEAAVAASRDVQLDKKLEAKDDKIAQDIPTANQAQEDKELEEAALKIQSVRRGQLARAATKDSHKDKEFEASTVTQAQNEKELEAARAAKDIQEAKELEEAALKIQSVRRGQLARAKASAGTETSSVTENDAQAKALEAQALKDIQEAKELEEAALKIQSVRRGQLARAQTSTRVETSAAAVGDAPDGKELEALAAEKAKEDKELEEAALKIQAVRRGQLARADTIVRKGVVNVLPFKAFYKVNFRGANIASDFARRNFMNEYAKQNAAARKIQQIRRGKIGRSATVSMGEVKILPFITYYKEYFSGGEDASDFARLNFVDVHQQEIQAALKIQSVRRGQLGRKKTSQ